MSPKAAVGWRVALFVHQMPMLEEKYNAMMVRVGRNRKMRMFRRKRRLVVEGGVTARSLEESRNSLFILLSTMKEAMSKNY